MVSYSSKTKLVNFAHKYLQQWDSVTPEELRGYIFDVQGKKAFWCPNDDKIRSLLISSKEFRYIRGNGKRKKGKFTLPPN